MSAAVACSQEGCEAPVGGACALGHASPVDCPQASAIAAVAGDQPSDSGNLAPAAESRVEQPEPQPLPGVPLRSGEALTEQEASRMAAEAGIRLTVPLGPVHAGKTTLAVGMYERFLRGQWGDAGFLWSDTLLDLEMLAFPARLASGADIPTTWRTKLKEDGHHLLHLRIRSGQVARADLVFGNLPGETSERIRNGVQADVELPLIRNADRVLVCIDGEHIASPGLAAIGISSARQTLRVLHESQCLRTGCQVALILTKFDLVSGDDGAENRWQDARDNITAEMTEFGMSIRSFSCSARPNVPTFAPDGMADLLSWISEPDTPELRPPINVNREASRAIEYFGRGDNG